MPRSVEIYYFGLKPGFNPPVIYIFMFYLPIRTMLVVKFVVGLEKRINVSSDLGKPKYIASNSLDVNEKPMRLVLNKAVCRCYVYTLVR